ncbi:MAG: hypothetical protein V1799_04870 [bacterium]
MKSTHIPLKSSEQSKSLKRFNLNEKRTGLKAKSTNRFRIGQSVNAGRVRGGHSFH